jgi:hypothetical protein
VSVQTKPWTYRFDADFPMLRSPALHGSSPAGSCTVRNAAFPFQERRRSIVGLDAFVLMDRTEVVRFGWTAANSLVLFWPSRLVHLVGDRGWTFDQAAQWLLNAARRNLLGDSAT